MRHALRRTPLIEDRIIDAHVGDVTPEVHPARHVDLSAEHLRTVRECGFAIATTTITWAIACLGCPAVVDGIVGLNDVCCAVIGASSNPVQRLADAGDHHTGEAYVLGS